MGDLIYYERNLPHRLPPGSSIFLTLRLAGSLPTHILAQLQAQFKSEENQTQESSYTLQRRYFGHFDKLLDQANHGPTWLQEPSIAAIVGASLRHFHESAYQLICYCLMPNHAHVVVALPDQAPPLIKTLQRLKGYTSLQANKLLGRSCQFW